MQPDHVTAMQTLRLEKGYPLYGNVTSEGHTVGKMLAVAYAESFHAGPVHVLDAAVRGRPRVATAATTPLFDPQDLWLWAEEAGWCRHATT